MELAIVTNSFVKIYDLSLDAISPSYYFIVCSGKIRDACVCVIEGVRMGEGEREERQLQRGGKEGSCSCVASVAAGNLAVVASDTIGPVNSVCWKSLRAIVQ